MKYRPLFPFGNALRGCEILTCNAPLERTKFMKTIDIGGYLAKGGRKDRKQATNSTRASQLSFLELLFHLDQKMVQASIAHADELRITEFEIESLNNIKWFQFFCERSSPQNYPDIFTSGLRRGMGCMFC